MIRKLIDKINDLVDDKLRQICGRITPEKRLGVILFMCVFFGGMSIYVFTSAIYNIGRNEGKRIKIEHIKGLELQQNDSINPYNLYNNERERD